jgi:hypothetical protein
MSEFDKCLYSNVRCLDLIVSVLGNLPFWNGPSLSAIMARIMNHGSYYDLALEVCGVDSAKLMGAIQFTVRQGVADVETFIAHSVKELDALATAINKARPLPGDDPVVLNQIVFKKLKAFWLWLLWRKRRGMEYDLGEFDADLHWGLDRMAFETCFTEADPPEPLLPKRLNSIG